MIRKEKEEEIIMMDVKKALCLVVKVLKKTMDTNMTLPGKMEWCCICLYEGGMRVGNILIRFHPVKRLKRLLMRLRKEIIFWEIHKL